MYIEYRLASERSVWRPLIINRTEQYILAEELNAILCKESNINYSNKIDIFLTIFKNEQLENIENEKEEYLKGDEKIYNGTRILVHRKIKQKMLATDICHDAKKQILVTKGDTEEEKQKFLLPIEFICKLCVFLLNESYIIVCSNNCGYSVCKKCILFYIFSKIIKENEKKTYTIDISLLNQKIKCPLCDGFLKYCILNKKLEITLQTLREERKDVDAYNINVEEINNKFYKLVKNWKIENFDYSNKNIFENEILKTIEKKFIYLNIEGSEGNIQDKYTAFVKTEITEDVNFNNSRNNEDENKLTTEKLNEESQQDTGKNLFTSSEENSVFNTFVYLLESNKLNCIKEYDLIYVDFDSVFFDSIKRVSLRMSQQRLVENDMVLNRVKVEEFQEENRNAKEIKEMKEVKDVKEIGHMLNNKMSECNSVCEGKQRETEKNNNNSFKHDNNNSNNNENKNDNKNKVKHNLNISEMQFNKNRIYFMPLSFVGGETSYGLIGILCIKELFVINGTENKSNKCKTAISESTGEETKKVAEEFLNKWFANEQNKKENILEKLYNGNIYKVEYFIKYEKICFFPAKKQPLYNIIHNKRQKKKKTDIEIVVDLKKFKEVICCVDDYIQYGSRPFQEEIKKNTAPFNATEEERKYVTTNEKMEKNNILGGTTPNNFSFFIEGGGQTQENKKQVNKTKTVNSVNGNNTEIGGGSVRDLPMHEQEIQEMLLLFYGTKIPPLSLHNKVDLTNPYLGYCALLPFLTKVEFDMIRDLQRISKEKYLKQLYKHVKKNKLDMKIFYAAVHSIFFMHSRQQL